MRKGQPKWGGKVAARPRPGARRGDEADCRLEGGQHRGDLPPRVLGAVLWHGSLPESPGRGLQVLHIEIESVPRSAPCRHLQGLAPRPRGAAAGDTSTRDRRRARAAQEGRLQRAGRRRCAGGEGAPEVEGTLAEIEGRRRRQLRPGGGAAHEVGRGRGQGPVGEGHHERLLDLPAREVAWVHELNIQAATTLPPAPRRRLRLKRQRRRRRRSGHSRVPVAAASTGVVEESPRQLHGRRRRAELRRGARRGPRRFSGRGRGRPAELRGLLAGEALRGSAPQDPQVLPLRMLLRPLVGVGHDADVDIQDHEDE
mmetsp:Transcript_47773/g.121150  ORF Transcript_47773/g.121150 Transcript_47773/m.121150 type:complete len:312 (-) Transcript_47773:555-1490(-)